MNKQQLIDKVTETVDVDKKDVKKIIENTLDILIEELSNKKTVNLVGFGAFETRLRKAKVGTDPLTHQKINIPENCYVGFKMGSKLKQKVRSGK